MAKAIEVVYLTRVEGANLNSSGTEGVISVLKKTEDIDGREYIRVSGQSVKYNIRQIWKESEKVSLSPIESRGTTEKVIVSEGDPVKYIDDDLFGYMIARTGGRLERKRTGCVRTNGMISLFPYKGDRDFAVRYDPNDPTGKHNIYEVELTTNMMRGNFFIELDRLGKFIKEEVGEERELQPDEKEKRVKALFDSIFNFFGGAHLSNYFTKTYPELIVIAILKRKLPIIGDKLTISGKAENEKYLIDKDRLNEALETFNENIEQVIIGGFETAFENWEAIKELSNVKIKVMSLKDAKTSISQKSFF